MNLAATLAHPVDLRKEGGQCNCKKISLENPISFKRFFKHIFSTSFFQFMDTPLENGTLHQIFKWQFLQLNCHQGQVMAAAISSSGVGAVGRAGLPCPIPTGHSALRPHTQPDGIRRPTTRETVEMSDGMPLTSPSLMRRPRVVPSLPQTPRDCSIQI